MRRGRAFQLAQSLHCSQQKIRVCAVGRNAADFFIIKETGEANAGFLVEGSLVLAAVDQGLDHELVLRLDICRASLQTTFRDINDII